MVATTQNVYLPSILRIIESVRATSTQIGQAISAIEQSLFIPPVKYSPVVQDMMGAWEGRYWASVRLADAIWFQLPPKLAPTLRRIAKKDNLNIKIARRQLVVRCGLGK